jgi:hypothetical protein
MPRVIHTSDPGFDTSTMSRIAQRVVAHPRVAYEADTEPGVPALVLALRDELLVHPSADTTELEKHAKQIGKLSGGAPPPGPGQPDRPPVPAEHDLQVWRLTRDALADGDSLRWARRLAPDEETVVFGGVPVTVTKITPHHVTVVSGYWDTCPSGEPTPAPAQVPASLPPAAPPWSRPLAAVGFWIMRIVRPSRPRWIAAFSGAGAVRVVVIDTGLIAGNPELDTRGGLGSEAGLWLDEDGNWTKSGEDQLPDVRGDGWASDIAGHGTFVTGLVAKQCPQADITVVGHRHEVMRVPDPAERDDGARADAARLFTSEIAVAATVARSLGADVVSCGFAFPTLDGYPSLGAWCALAAAWPARPAIVSPAGNEETSAEYWPAAHPRVIGVAATGVESKAGFSNWGGWVDCCARGDNVFSSFVNWPGARLTFNGWARWSGTCFAAPKVTGAIASVVAGSAVAGTPLAPVDAFQELVQGRQAIGTRAVTAAATGPAATLTELMLG